MVGSLQVYLLIYDSDPKYETHAICLGDDQDLVLHMYAAGSQLDDIVKQQNKNAIAVTSEDEVDEAEMDDPDYDGDDDIYGDAINGTASGTGTNAGGNAVTTSVAGLGSHVTSTPAAAAPVTSTPATAAAKVVSSSGSFKYVGCELDSSTSRTLSSLSWSGTGLTVERCAAYCAEYQYMGVEFGSEYVLSCGRCDAMR